MRVILKVAIPVAKGNQALTDGTLGRVMQKMHEAFKLEASYNCLVGGKRGGYYVFDMADPSQIPVICEPLFQELEAEVEIIPVMIPDDLMKGITAAGQARQGTP